MGSNHTLLGRHLVALIAVAAVACGSGSPGKAASPAAPTPRPTPSAAPLETAAPLPQSLVLTGSATGSVTTARALCPAPDTAATAATAAPAAPSPTPGFSVALLIPIGRDMYVLTLTATRFAGAGQYVDPGQGVGSTAPAAATGTITLAPEVPGSSSMQTQRPYNSAHFTVDPSLTSGTLDTPVFHPPSVGDVGISGSWRCR